MNNIKKQLKKIWAIKKLVLTYYILKNNQNALQKIRLLNDYFNDLKKYKKLENKNFRLNNNDLKPCIYDKVENTPVDPVYFYQDSWCAGKIFKEKPVHHYDIGSNTHMIGIISQFVPTTMIDIRPINLEINGLSFEKGSIFSLPFKDSSIESLSSICVIEHIGLGRYGDTLDSYGTEKSIKELIRVLKNGGNLYISVPVDDDNKIYFNVHRAFTRNYILKLFSELKLVEEKYIYGRKLFDSYDRSKGFGTGMYHFTK